MFRTGRSFGRIASGWSGNPGSHLLGRTSPLGLIVGWLEERRRPRASDVTILKWLGSGITMAVRRVKDLVRRSLAALTPFAGHRSATMRVSVLLAVLLAMPAFGEFAEVHGVKMYYEIHGEGRPVVLLHGGLASIHLSFAKQIPVLARNHRVIAIEQI